MTKKTKEEEIAELRRARADIDKRLKQLIANGKPQKVPDKKALLKKYSALRK